MMDEDKYSDWVPLNKRDKLSFIRILAIASGNLVPGLLWNIVFALLEPFVKKLGIDPTTKTLVLLYGSLIGFIGPVVGVISDGLMFKYGRRRIFVVIGSILVVTSLLLMMFCYQIGGKLSPSNPTTSRKVIFIVALIVAFTAGNIIQSPARVLCSDLTPPKQQSLMSNICQVYNGVSSIFSNLLGGLEIYKYTSLNQEQFLLVVSLSIAAVAMCISVIASREEPLHVKPPKVNPFKQIYRAFKTIPKPFARVIPAFTLAYVAIYQYQVAFSGFMGAEIMGGDNSDDAPDDLNKLYQKGLSWSMMCNVMNNVVQLVYGFLNAKVCEKIGMKWTMVLGNAVLSAGLLPFLFVRKNRYAYLAFTGMIGFGNVIFMAVPYAIVSLIIPTEELGNNLGILNCFGVFGQIISNFGIGMGVGKLCNNSLAKKIGYSSVFGFLATIASLWIIQPSLAETGNYDKIPDESETGNAGQLSMVD